MVYKADKGENAQSRKQTEPSRVYISVHLHLRLLIGDPTQNGWAVSPELGNGSPKVVITLNVGK